MKPINLKLSRQDLIEKIEWLELEENKIYHSKTFTNEEWNWLIQETKRNLQEKYN